MSKVNYYVYILKCSDGKNYYGSTNNLLFRLKRHKEGLVKSTKGRLPVRLIYFEEYPNKDEAFKREKQLKGGRTRKKTIDSLILAFPYEKLFKYEQSL